MIQAFIFDLDGTLINSEPIRIRAHVRAALELSTDGLRAEDVIAIAPEFIGVPAPETARQLVQRLGLEAAARARMAELGVSEPWQVYSRLQVAAYYDLLDEANVGDAPFPHTAALLHTMRRAGFKVGLGTMSTRRETQRVLDILGWTGLFGAVLTTDDVRHGKPDPEIYLRVAGALGVAPHECLVIEDSPSGIGSALAAGMRCIAVTSNLTRAAVHHTRLDHRRIVDDPARLREVVAQELDINNPGRDWRAVLDS